MRYSPTASVLDLYSILSLRPMKGAQSPALRRRICVVTVRATKLGQKKGPGLGPRRSIRWFHPKYERGTVRRKSSPRVLPMISIAATENALLHVVCFALRGPRPARVENPSGKSLANVRCTARRNSSFRSEEPKHRRVGNYRFTSAALYTKLAQSLGRGW